MENLIDSVGIFVFIFVIINIVFASLVYFHSNRNKIVLFYSGISFFTSLWALTTIAIGITGLPEYYFKLAFNLHYIFGILAYFSFFWFSIFYPFRKTRSLNWSLFFSFFIIFVPLTLILSGNIFQISIPGNDSGQSIIFKVYGYSIFILSLAAIFSAGLFALFRKLKELSGEKRLQVFYVLLANFIAGSFGIYLNLILPFFGNFKFFFINPILVTLALTGIGVYSLFKYNLFNIKLIATELLVFLIWVFMMGRIFLATSPQERFINGSFLLFSVILGVFLIRSVIKEIQIRKQIEGLVKEMAMANERLQKMEEHKSEFISIASHQLRTPLTVIKGYTSMALEGSFGKLSSEGQSAGGRLFRATQKIVDLVDDLLTLSRIERGKNTLMFTPVSIHEVAAQVVDEMKTPAKESGLTLTLMLDSSDQHLIEGDHDKLKQVFRNLIENAFRFTRVGSVRVSLSCNENTERLRIAVSDTGIGIAKENLDRVFDHFSTLVSHEKENKSVHTANLGLYLVKEIIKEHRGMVWAESAGVGQGATIIVELPFQRSESIQSKSL